jgi:hypothetical protein
VRKQVAAAAAVAVAVSRVGGEVGREEVKNAIHLFHLNQYALFIVQSTAAAPVRAFCFVWEKTLMQFLVPSLSRPTEFKSNPEQAFPLAALGFLARLRRHRCERRRVVAHLTTTQCRSRHDTTRHDTMQITTQHNIIQHDTTRHSTTQHNKTHWQLSTIQQQHCMLESSAVLSCLVLSYS